MAELPRWEVEQIIRDAGAQRVSEDATKKLLEILEDEAEQIIQKAEFLARYAGRKRISKEDIRLAIS
ncbi:MAG: NFYB/HAP3 family transcription factor subunit [Candidatus Micrarchaeota archaeon]|nr:NFYB/HAP3 family transcription factor subunit [Candidatus Micrarchaeota archaeon]